MITHFFCILNSGSKARHPHESIERLEKWFASHIENPYPSSNVKEELARECDLTVYQIHRWLINKRISRKKETKTEENRNIVNRKILKDHFRNKNQKPSKTELLDLQALTGLTKQKVSAWFAKERFNSKKNTYV